jgi:replication factor A1
MNMAIKDLQAKQGNVDLTFEVIEKGDVREFQKFGKSGRVCNAVAKDETGTIKLTLWNDDIDKINVGDKVHLINGYVNEFQGELQLTTGKFGKFEVIGKAEVKKEDVKTITSDELEEPEEFAKEEDIE